MEEKVHAPTIGELPTTKQLNRATLVAVGVAAVLLATVVLPAEYGIDPTGTGALLGLTEMGAMKSAGSKAPVSTKTGEPTLKAGAPIVYSLQSSEQTVTLAPGEGREVKAEMQTGGEFEYEWKSSGTPVHYEFHGEPAGAKNDEYTSYTIAVSTGEKGNFRAPFAGTQGWYWRNDGKQPVTVTVRAKGTWANFVVVPE